MKAGEVKIIRDTRRGFSLIEMLAVLLIIGLGISLVSLTVGGGDTARKMRAAAGHFSAVAKLAADEAVLSGEPIGLTLVPAGREQPWQYYWQRYRDGEWQPEPEPLDRQLLPASVLLEVEVEGQAVEWSARDVDQAKSLPAVVFYASGEATAFSLLFYSDEVVDAWQRVSVNLASQVSWLDGDTALE